MAIGREKLTETNQLFTADHGGRKAAQQSLSVIGVAPPPREPQLKRSAETRRRYTVRLGPH